MPVTPEERDAAIRILTDTTGTHDRDAVLEAGRTMMRLAITLQEQIDEDGTR
jgi:hypothetical protein